MPAPTRPAPSYHAIVHTLTPWRTCLTSLYFQSDEVPTQQAHIQGMANAVSTHFGNAWAACMTDGCAFLGVLLQYNGAGDVFLEAMSAGAVIRGTATSAESPSLGSETMPDESCVVIRKLTGRAGPEDRGRIFMSGIPEIWNKAGQLEDAALEPYTVLGSKLPNSIVISIAAGGDVEAFATMLNARHWNRKENVLRPIIGHLTNSTIQSRRDRRKPLLGNPLAPAVIP